MVDPALDREYRSSSAWGDAGLYDWWRASLAAVPDQAAVVDSRGFRATYREVDDQASRLAGHLREAGVGHGDVVDVLMPNWGEYLVVDVACLKLGAIISPTLPQHRFSELRYQVDRCRASAMVMVTKFHSIDHAEEVERLTRDCPHLKTVLTLGEGTPDPAHFITFCEALAHEPIEEADCTPGSGNDVAAVLFTSGSEAQPKGVMLTHNNVIASERGFIEALGLEFGERMFMPAPIAHATGYLHGITMPIMIRGTSILLDAFSGREALRMVNTERATCTMGSTTIIRDLLDAADELGGFHRGLHRICCGGAPVPRSLVERALGMGVTVHSVYGATESAPHTMTRPEDPLDRVVNTDGRAVPGTQVRIVDPDTHESLPAGAEGEAASKGPAVFVGYLGDPERTHAVRDQDGWYYSGDLAVMDADGYIRITGRIKDTIVRGGENISPREVEDLLLLHPSVRDAAVVAMPNPRLGECACAFVVLRPGAATLTLEDVRAFFAVKEVARFKTPERVEIVDALPMTVTGKVRKVELREQINALVAKEGAADLSSSQALR
jgi:acyl-CoA synthetase